jgi:hypothetical protein
MTELELLRAENEERKEALAELDVSVAIIIGMMKDASAVMQKVGVAMRASHPDIAARADIVIAHWSDFIAGAQAAKTEDALANAPTTTARN